MKTFRTGTAILAAVTFLGTASTFAQSDAQNGSPAVTVEHDRNYTPLLGLLGLLGLMGLKRHHDNRDVVVDRR